MNSPVAALSGRYAGETAYIVGSGPWAVQIARLMGVAGLVMLGQDAYTRGDSRVVVGDTAVDGSESFPGYLQGGQQSDALARAAGMAIRWVA